MLNLIRIDEALQIPEDWLGGVQDSNIAGCDWNWLRAKLHSNSYLADRDFGLPAEVSQSRPDGWRTDVIACLSSNKQVYLLLLSTRSHVCFVAHDFHMLISLRGLVYERDLEVQAKNHPALCNWAMSEEHEASEYSSCFERRCFWRLFCQEVNVYGNLPLFVLEFESRELIAQSLVMQVLMPKTCPRGAHGVCCLWSATVGKDFSLLFWSHMALWVVAGCLWFDSCSWSVFTPQWYRI